jgi:hypothetical protein
MAAGLLSLATPVVTAQEQGGIATYRNERHGFSLSYPAGTFAAQPPPTDAEGRVFVSRDGNARLLAGALPNADGVNLRGYRSNVISTTASSSRSPAATAPARIAADRPGSPNLANPWVKATGVRFSVHSA